MTESRWKMIWDEIRKEMGEQIKKIMEGKIRDRMKYL